MTSPAILTGRLAALVCVGGPCAGIKVRDTGAERYKVAIPLVLGMLRDRPAADHWAEYHRAEFGFDGVLVTVLVYGSLDTPGRVVAELVRGYAPPAPGFQGALA